VLSTPRTGDLISSCVYIGTVDSESASAEEKQVDSFANDKPEDQDEEEEADVPADLEDIVGYLLSALKDKDTVVRCAEVIDVVFVGRW